MSAKPIEKDTPEGAEIIPFGIPKTAGDGGKPKDWLRALPMGSFFLSKAKAGTPSQQAFFDRWGVAAIIPEAYMLAAPSKINPIAYEFFWVDTQKFSELNRFVALLPEVQNEGDDNHQGEDDG